MKRVVDILLHHLDSFPPEVEIYAIPLSIAIYAIMIPLFFDVIVKIDTKYKAEYFRNIFLSSCEIIWSIAVATINLALIAIYILFRHYDYEIIIRIALCLSSTCLLLCSIASLLAALDFNNPERLLKRIFDKYSLNTNAAIFETYIKKDGSNFSLSTNDDFKHFFSLLTHLLCYAETSNVEFMYVIRQRVADYIISWKKYYKEHVPNENSHPKTSYTIIYPFELYDMLVHACKNYKKSYDDVEINSIIASLLAELFDCEGDNLVETNQDTYNAVFQALFSCISNEHESLINDFQRSMRIIYYYKKAKHVPDAAKFHEFALIINAVLHGKGLVSCVENAIKNNYDVGITDYQLLPKTATESIELYLWLNDTPRLEWHHYVYVINNYTSSTNYTQFQQYLIRYFAYLIVRQYHQGEERSALEYCGYYQGSNILIALDHSLPNQVRQIIKSASQGLNKLIPNKLLEKVKIHSYESLYKEIATTPIEIDKCIENIMRDIEPFDILAHLKELATYNSIYMRGDNSILQLPPLQIDDIERQALMHKYQGLHSNFISSKIFEKVMDNMAEVYNSFERTVEFVSWKDIKKRVNEFVNTYDYSYLTIGAKLCNILNYSVPVMGRFTQYFPQNCVIIISKPNLPYFEWNKHAMRITCIEDSADKAMDIQKWAMPKAKVTIEMNMCVQYKRDVKIFVLKVV